MQQTINQKATQTRGNCIGCTDCTGVCLALFDLAFVPATVIKAQRSAR